MGALNGQTIKGYELREAIGAGSYGAVYRAFQPTIGREVAIKVILPQFANQPDFIRRFEVEAQFIARLEHPHIVPLYDYWRDPTGAYLVMRWLRGSLRASLQRAPWTLEATARLLDQIGPALTSAHREGIVHRDLKPANILLDEDANAYLADFGIALDVYLRAELAAHGADMPVESAEYLSPEEIRGEEVTPRSDLYCLGYVLYEMLTGEKPFPDATTSSDYLQKHLKSALPMMSIQHTHIPAAMDEVLQTATAKDPTHRYASALRFAAAFRAALPATQPRIPPQPLADALTERELEVLDLIVAGLSNAEIADRLFVTSGTVKWYAKQIYSKLDVHSRYQAIERAERMGLLKRGGQRVHTAAEVAEPARYETSELAAPVAVENPYKGLRAFREADAADFFGRAGMTERLLSRLSEKGDTSRFLVIVGPSGSGKSSLVRAGLLPALRSGALAQSPHPFIADLLPGTHPLEELEAALLRVAANPVPRLLDQLREDRRGLVRAARQVLPSDLETELIVLVDQFEEVFTLTADEEMRAHFIDNLLSAATDPRSRVRVILTLRADFYDRPLLYPRLAELVRAGTEVVVPLTAREMEQAITAPAERAGLRLEAGLVSTILKDLGEQPGTLPLLQYALTELFERRDGVTLTLAAYQAMNGVKGALTRRADEILESLDSGQQALARQMFLRMVTLGYGVEDTRRRVLQAELNALGDETGVEEVIGVFADYRLLTLDHDLITRGPTVEIAHEALLREWGPLRMWLNESREDIRLQRQLSAAAQDWQTARSEESFLLRGARLERLGRWADETTLALTADERDYLQASRAAAEQAELAEAERKGRESRLRQRSQTFLRVLVLVMLLATLGAVVLSALAVRNAREADAERDRAERNALDAEAERANVQVALATSDANFTRAEQQRLYLAANEAMDSGATGNVGSALALNSLAYGYTPGADAALLRASRQGVTRLELGDLPFDVYGIRFSPDTSRIAIATEGGTYVFDAAKGTQLLMLPQAGVVRTADFTPDGGRLLTAADRGEVVLWDLRDGRALHTWAHDEGAVYAYFTPSGRQIVIALVSKFVVRDGESGEIVGEFPYTLDDSRELLGLIHDERDGFYYAVHDTEDHSVTLRDPETGEVSCTLLPAGEQAIELFFWDYIGPLALLATDDHVIQAWDMEQCQPLGRFTEHDTALYAADIDSVHRRAATGDESGKVFLWDLDSGTAIAEHVSSNRIGSLDISPDGQSLAAGRFNTVLVWDLSFPRQPRQFWMNEGMDSSFPRFTADGETLYLGGFGNYSRWQLTDGEFTQEFVYEQPIRTLDVTSDGRQIFYSTEEFIGLDLYSAFLADAETGEVLREFTAHTDGINFVDISPDDTMATTPSFDLNIGLWDLETGELLHMLTGHTGIVSSAVFSPDSTRLVSTGTDGTLRIWDTATGETLRVIDLGNPMAYADWSSDGRHLAAGDTVGMVTILDAESGEVLHRIAGHTDVIWSTHFSPDGQQIVTASWDGTARIWDVASGNLVRVLDDGDREALFWAEFSPDGQWIATSGDRSDHANLWYADLDAVIAETCARPIMALTLEQLTQYGIIDANGICPD